MNPLSELSQTALEELGLVIDLFEKATSHPVAKNGLVSKPSLSDFEKFLNDALIVLQCKPILRRLRDKATNNVTSAMLHDGSTASASPPQIKTEEIDEALSIIGGTSRLVREERRPFDPVVSEASAPSFIPYSIPSNVSNTTHTSSNLQNQRVIEADNGMPVMQASGSAIYMQGLQEDSFGWGPQISSDIVPNLGFGNVAGASSSDISLLSIVDAMQLDTQGSSTFAMNMSTGNIGELQPRHDDYYSGVQENSQVNDFDASIEDIWCTILEDPCLTNTGVNEPSFQF